MLYLIPVLFLNIFAIAGGISYWAYNVQEYNSTIYPILSVLSLLIFFTLNLYLIVETFSTESSKDLTVSLLKISFINCPPLLLSLLFFLFYIYDLRIIINTICLSVVLFFFFTIKESEYLSYLPLLKNIFIGIVILVEYYNYLSIYNHIFNTNILGAKF